eukprot:14803076-Alexandrium_andersonii.AAC.1
MSASLVGSEMCIRDSYRVLPRTTAYYRVLPRPTAYYRVLPRATACYRVCLLYTSDAADDM